MKQAVLTSLLFLVVYGGSSWITSLRAPVSVIRFSWEDVIPFLPWMVIPYMSIDVFFVATPFLCTSRRELRLFSRRIIMAILVAGACFCCSLCNWQSNAPSPQDIFGQIYNWFCSLDRPYNLLPSLHITLRTLLAYTWSKHTRGLANLLCHVGSA